MTRDGLNISAYIQDGAVALTFWLDGNAIGNGMVSLAEWGRLLALGQKARYVAAVPEAKETDA